MRILICVDSNIHSVNWKDFWNKMATSEDAQAQVGRVGGRVRPGIMSEIAGHTASLLDLMPDDTLLDVCCGNGELTQLLSLRCKAVTGIDFSERLIQHARQSYPDIRFECMDALNLNTNDFPRQFDKINLYFSFQYFESKEAGEQVIKSLLKLLKPGGKILLGDIPDRRFFFSYYRTPVLVLRFIASKFRGTNDMGKFWSEKELNDLCRKLKVSGKRCAQPDHLPYAHYRMDYIITT